MSPNDWRKEPPTREGWKFCDGCSALKPGWHVHGDPLEAADHETLLAELRRVQLGVRSIAIALRTSNQIKDTLWMIDSGETIYEAALELLPPNDPELERAQKGDQ